MEEYGARFQEATLVVAEYLRSAMDTVRTQHVLLPVSIRDWLWSSSFHQWVNLNFTVIIANLE